MVAARHSLRALSQSRPGLYICRSCRQHLFDTGVPLQQTRLLSGVRATVERAKEKSWSDRNFAGPKGTSNNSSCIQRRYLQNRATAGLTASSRVQEEEKEAMANTVLTSGTAEGGYVPAASIDDLEFVGFDGDWRGAPSQPNELFSAWLSPIANAANNRTQLVSCLHQAMVECLTCKEAGLDPSFASNIDAEELDSEAFSSSKISVSTTGRPETVQFASEQQRSKFLDLLAAAPNMESSHRQDSGLDAVHFPSESAADGQIQGFAEPGTAPQLFRSNALHYNVHDESFLNSQLDAQYEPAFSIIKRFSELSGHRIPDPAINAVLSSNNPLSVLIEHMLRSIVQPKPKKVAEALMNKPGLADQSNLMVFPRRETSVDKEMEVGRWKVIEKELRARGLPVPGRLRI